MQSRSTLPILSVLITALLVLAACGSSAPPRSFVPLPPNPYPEPGGPYEPGDPPPAPPTDPGGGEPSFPSLSGGVLVTVDTGGEIWRWWVTNPATATLLQQAWSGTYTGGFHGRLRAGPGEAGHNEPWSWHVDSEANGGDMVFFQPPAPGSSPHTPSECENQLAQWLTKDTEFVPYRPVQILTFDDRRP